MANKTNTTTNATTNEIQNAATVTITKNEEHKGIELLFDGKPDSKIRTALKSNGFKWHNGKGVWYAKDTEKTELLAKKVAEFFKANEKAEEPKAAEPKKAEKPAKAEKKADKKATKEVKAEVKKEVKKPTTKAQYIELIKVTTQIYADGKMDFDTYYKALNKMLDEMMALSDK